MRNHPATRAGFTLMELMLVLALLIILAAVTLPSFAGLQGNSRQKAAVDLLRARIADARARAMEDNVAYRLAVSGDGTKVRLAPDTLDFASMPADPTPGPATKVSEETLDRASAGVAADPDEPAPANDGSGWVTIATFLPDGTCREATANVEVREPGYPPIVIHIRGVTGHSRVLPNHPTGPGGQRP